MTPEELNAQLKREPVAEGQTWRNKKTGVITKVLNTPNPGVYNASVLHKGRRTTHTSVQNFYRKYERVTESGETA